MEDGGWKWGPIVLSIGLGWEPTRGTWMSWEEEGRSCVLQLPRMEAPLCLGWRKALMTHEAMKEIPRMDEHCLPSGTAPRKRRQPSGRWLRYDVMNEMRGYGRDR